MAVKSKVKATKRGPQPLAPESLREVLGMVRGRINGKSFAELGEKYEMAPQSVIRRIGDLCFKVRKGIQPLKGNEAQMIKTLEKERLISLNYARHGRSDQRG